MTLTTDIVAILQEDLGPSATIFLDRCCKKHLGIRSGEITRENIGPLADCCYSGIRDSLGQPVAEKIRQNLLALR